MADATLTGNDTVTINNRIFSDLADGDVVKLTFPNDVAQVKTGKNGNSIYALNETGKQCEVDIRLIRGSADDNFLNGLFAQQQANFAGFILMQGQFIKKLGDGQGNITSDTYVVSGGIFRKEPEATSNVEGNTDQSVVIWMFKFSNAPRALT